MTDPLNLVKNNIALLELYYPVVLLNEYKKSLNSIGLPIIATDNEKQFYKTIAPTPLTNPPPPEVTNNKKKKNKNKKKKKNEVENKNDTKKEGEEGFPTNLMKNLLHQPSSDVEVRKFDNTFIPPTPEEIAYGLIIERLEENYEVIMEDLSDDKKDEHWIWWVFPSSKPGANEIRRENKGSSYLNSNVFQGFLKSLKFANTRKDKLTTLQKWENVLGKIIGLFEKKYKVKLYQRTEALQKIVPDGSILPIEDHGRILLSSSFIYQKLVAMKGKTHYEDYGTLKELFRVFHTYFDWSEKKKKKI
jgi:hypothetical protein